jgi:hypothetical protein
MKLDTGSPSVSLAVDDLCTPVHSLIKAGGRILPNRPQG